MLVKLLLTLFLIGTTCVVEADNLVKTAKNAGKFSTLLKAATVAGLAKNLANDGPYTIFAPSDLAFSKVSSELLEELLMEKNKSNLSNILKYHVVEGTFTSDKLPLLPLETLNNQNIKFTTNSDSVFVNDARVVQADIKASNGIIHVIDKVLTPPTSQSDDSARSIIMRGIRMGVPQFNHGNHSACASIYEITLRNLKLLPQNKLNERNRQMVTDTLYQMSKMRSSTDKAWEARETFDKLMLTEL